MKKIGTILLLLVIPFSILTAQNNQLISNNDFNKLLVDLRNETNTNNRLAILKTISNNNKFTCQQIVIIANKFNRLQSSERIKVVEILYPKAVDKNNSHVLIELVQFNSDKERIAQIIRQNP